MNLEGKVNTIRQNNRKKIGTASSLCKRKTVPIALFARRKTCYKAFLI
jgi:hypothetical protein